jgi:hypothetical protein
VTATLPSPATRAAPNPALVDELVSLTQRWAGGQAYDDDRLVTVRTALIDATAAHASAQIPIYRRLVTELGAGHGDRPLLDCDVFKAYDPRWIDDGDWRSMTGWLAGLHDRPPLLGRRPSDLDDWLAVLEHGGTRAVCSSGSSGMLSFVPRSAQEWELARFVGTAALAPLIARRVGRRSERVALRAATATLGPRRVDALTQRAPRRREAAFVLDFADGRTGNQVIGRELARAVGVRHYLYPGTLSAVGVRALARGPRTAADVAALRLLQDELVDGADAHMTRLVAAMRAGASSARRAFVFGTPHQLLQLVTAIERSGHPVLAPRGSVVFFGGGWKNFDGGTIQRDQLIARVCSALGVRPEFVLEGYSMTELNTMLLRCEDGRFHIPPLIEGFVVDPSLRESPTGTGRFGFRDPLATSRPGFLVTGDAVTLVDDTCPCGLTGAAITAIARAGRHEVKGCAGIAASLPV